MTATMININRDSNDEILGKCSILKDYSTFIECVRKHSEEKAQLETAVGHAIEECIREDVLREILLSHKSEVFDMILTEYDEQQVLDTMYEDGRAEGLEAGRAEGLEAGRAEGIRVVICRLNENGMDLEQIAEATGLTKAEVEGILEAEY